MLGLLEKSAFAYSSLRLICLPNHVTSLGDSCFEWRSCLVSFTYESLDATSTAFGASNMQHIGSYCFASSGLTTFKIPNCLMALCPGSFHSYRLLEKVTFEQGCHLKEIPELCFACCGFELIVIPTSRNAWQVELLFIESQTRNIRKQFEIASDMQIVLSVIGAV
jgi:hypothetical protein